MNLRLDTRRATKLVSGSEVRLLRLALAPQNIRKLTDPSLIAADLVPRP